MLYYSTQDPEYQVSFQEALLTGLAPGGGLYLPQEIPSFTEEDLNLLKGKSLSETAFFVAERFIEDEIPTSVLRKICEEAYDFEVPIKKLEEDGAGVDIRVLELFHGPTLAFKDFAARFMARCVDYFLGEQDVRKTILVATSGDTGGAIGNGFLGMDNVDVNILYPKGGVSPVQEAQLTTMGGNIRAFEVNGSFDDCQRMVKEAFMDEALNEEFDLMSANSINVGRILPQSFYYVWSSLQLDLSEDQYLVYSVPSGNMGNITGAYFAQKMGSPIDHLVVSNNNNHPFVDYLESGEFEAVPSVPTISNAMDIGHPNNYYRIEHLFSGNVDRVRDYFSGYTFDDPQTLAAMQESYNRYGYLMCPHTAVGYLGAKAYLEGVEDDVCMVVAGTAHPAKFSDVVGKAGLSVEIPESLAKALEKEKKSVVISPSLDALSSALMKIV